MDTEERHRQALDSHGYDLLTEIGIGSFAHVYKIYSRSYQQEFAVKIVPVGHKQEKLLNSFDAELNSLMRLLHPNIIQLFNFFKTEFAYYLILEWCPYGTYQEYVEKNGPLSMDELIPVCTQVIYALKHCHNKGVVHRDLKPSNIFIDKYQRPKLADFGLASLYEEGEFMEIFVGSKAFIPPEIYNRKPYDAAKADVWSLGVTFYYLAAGKLPWNMTDTHKLEESIYSGCFPIPQSIGVTFGTILRKMIQVDPYSRAGLEELINSEPFSSFIQQNQGLPRLKSTKHIALSAEDRNNLFRTTNVLTNYSYGTNISRNSTVFLKPSMSILDKRRASNVGSQRTVKPLFRNEQGKMVLFQNNI